MKYKYVILKDDDTKNLIIREYAEIDKDNLSFVCEEAYADKMIATTISKGGEALISALRTPNFYPSGDYTTRIAESIIDYYQGQATAPVEVLFDDIDFIPKERVRYLAMEDAETESPDVDEIIEEEDYDEEYDRNPGVKKNNSSLAIADEDEYDDFDEEDDQ